MYTMGLGASVKIQWSYFTLQSNKLDHVITINSKNVSKYSTGESTQNRIFHVALLSIFGVKYVAERNIRKQLVEIS